MVHVLEDIHLFEKDLPLFLSPEVIGLFYKYLLLLVVVDGVSPKGKVGTLHFDDDRAVDFLILIFVHHIIDYRWIEYWMIGCIAIKEE